MNKTVYLDNSATTPLRAEVLQDMVRIYQQVPGNPSSLHLLGLEADRELNNARSRLAHCLKVAPEEIIFTSGGTEANNLAIRGVVGAYGRQTRNHIVTTSIEHPSVLNVCSELEEAGYQVTYCPVDRQGLILMEELQQVISDQTLLVSVMLVNNEVGSIQPISHISRRIKSLKTPPLFHVDAVQAFGRFQINPRQLGIDLLSFSAHKIGGPKGVGALYARNGVRLKPLWAGGGQEKGYRPGTENVAGAIGLAKAAEITLAEMPQKQTLFREMRAYLVDKLGQYQPDIEINGADGDWQASYIINMRIPGVRGEVLVRHLERENVFVSTQAACSSRKKAASHVLRAMGSSELASEESLRVSLGYHNTIEDLDRFVYSLDNSVKQIRNLIGR